MTLTESPEGVGVGAGKAVYAGTFMISLAALMYELILTRIFSVTMWYHFAFVAISIAMFGATVGAILVYVFPALFPRERSREQLAWSALLFGVTVILSFLLHLRIHVVQESSSGEIGWDALAPLAFTYIVISIPFVFSGVCICLALTRFPADVGRLYAADLAGAALGCVALIAALNVMGAPRAVTFVGLTGAVAALCFSRAQRNEQVKRFAWAGCAALALLWIAQLAEFRPAASLFDLVWVKGLRAKAPLYEKWNSFSRIEVHGDPDELVEPMGWAFSSTKPEKTIRQLFMQIDAAAATPITHFDGDFTPVEFLRFDVTNAAHFLRSGGDVLVIGPGGGRDILSALLFGQRSVTAVEINGAIVETVNGRFGDFSGHLDRLPNVKFVNDEARSYLARDKSRYDLLQISLIDTFAATTAGAFVLSENSLYTHEAWSIFLDRLNERGILAVSHWYFPDRPAAIYRLTATARAALDALGVENPRDHVMIVRSMHGLDPEKSGVGVATVLVSRSPFSPGDIRKLESVAETYRYQLVLTPRSAEDETFASLAGPADARSMIRDYPLDISAPTDDRPFFFNQLRFRDMFDRELGRQGHMSFNFRAVSIVGLLLIVVFALTLACVVLPLALTAGRRPLAGAPPLLVYFAAIGLGFIFVEISQMQRLVVFLGHPTYALSVVLATLLLSSGLGSLSTRRIAADAWARAGAWRWALLLAALLVFGSVTPWLAHALESATTPVRIAVAAALLFPLGFAMGMAFPLGMRAAAAKSQDLTPWLWGINGATSVCASVLSVVISLAQGISAAYWTGFACYVVAAAAFAWRARSSRMDVRR